MPCAAHSPPFLPNSVHWLSLERPILVLFHPTWQVQSHLVSPFCPFLLDLMLPCPVCLVLPGFLLHDILPVSGAGIFPLEGSMEAFFIYQRCLFPL